MATNRLTRRQFVVALTLPALLRTSGVGAQTGRTTLSLATAGPGSAFLGFARTVAPVVAKRVPVDLDIRQTNGSNENAELVNSGQVPMATLNLGPGYDAWNGRGQFAGRTLRDIRTVIPMYETPFPTIALKEEGIGALRDLARKRVGVGSAQGPGEVFFRGLADGLGLKPTVVTGSPADLVQKLLAREIDAFWYGAELPSPPFVEIASTASRPGRASESQQHSFLGPTGPMRRRSKSYRENSFRPARCVRPMGVGHGKGRMKMARSFSAAFIGVVAVIFGAAPSSAQNAYITNAASNTVSVIDTATNTVTGLPIPVGILPRGVAVTPDGGKVYVANTGSNTVSVIDTATNSVVGTIPVGNGPTGVAVTPDSSKVYVTNPGTNTVSVIATATNTVVSTIPVGNCVGVAVTPDGSKVYITNLGDGSVSVIDTVTNTVTGLTIPVGIQPFGVAVTPDGSKVYVANEVSASVSVIDTATNAVVGTIPVGNFPIVFPIGVAVTPDGSKVYVTNGASAVSVIDTATNTVVGTIPVGSLPWGVAVTPDGSKVYVANFNDNTVSVIATATNTVVSTVPVGLIPIAFGIFIQPPSANSGKDACKDGGWRKFVSSPGPFQNQGQCVSYIAKQQ